MVYPEVLNILYITSLLLYWRSPVRVSSIPYGWQSMQKIITLNYFEVAETPRQILAWLFLQKFSYKKTWFELENWSFKQYSDNSE